jgi:hypothetical protein
MPALPWDLARFCPLKARKNHRWDFHCGPRLRSRLRACEPVQWPAFGVGDSQHEQMSLVLLERDHVGEPLDGGLANQRVSSSGARPCRVRFRRVAKSIEGGRNLGDELGAQSWPSLVVPKRGAAKLGTRFQGAVRGARRCSSSFRIAARAVSQLVV